MNQGTDGRVPIRDRIQAATPNSVQGTVARLSPAGPLRQARRRAGGAGFSTSRNSGSGRAAVSSLVYAEALHAGSSQTHRMSEANSLACPFQRRRADPGSSATLCRSSAAPSLSGPVRREGVCAERGKGRGDNRSCVRSDLYPRPF